MIIPCAWDRYDYTILFSSDSHSDGFLLKDHRRGGSLCPPVGLHEIVPAPAQFNGQLFFDTDYTGFVVTEILAVATARVVGLAFSVFLRLQAEG